MDNRNQASASLPSRIYDYDVIDFIGEGAGSLIYAVSHRTSKQIYALKHVVRKTEKDIRFIDQLENEYTVGSAIRHRGVRGVVDMKTNRSLLRKPTEAALVMELFDGVPLDQQASPGMRRLVGCFVDTARALQAVHTAGFVHCDLKPNNILFSADCETKVIDLGQACPIGTKKERIQGTPDYIAPEQVKCEPVTQRTDVFNFGATMYWCLTGRKVPTLFTLKKGGNSFLLDDAIPSPHLIDSRVPQQLSNLIMECVRTSVNKRPGDMGELASRLETMEHGLALASLEDSAVGAA